MDRKKILAIDDAEQILYLLKTVLELQNYTVTTATSGKSGLKKLKKEAFDLIILDLMMPDMDGWEVYQQMKADTDLREIPVVVVTAKAQSIDKVLGLHIAKVDDYITKPFGPQELLESVEKIIGEVE